MVQTWYIFHNNLKGNLYGQVYFHEHCSLLPEKNPSHFLKLQEIVSGGGHFFIETQD